MNGRVVKAWDAGSTPSSIAYQPDSLIEIKPMGKTGGEVVWEWHLWDHLIQDADKDKANFGDVGAHPERVSSCTASTMSTGFPVASREPDIC